MIARIWHGYTTPKNADAYEALLYREVIPGIEAMNIEGFQKITVLRRAMLQKEEVEFITIMEFDSLESVKNFMGENYSESHVPQAAQQLLKRFDKSTAHYEIRKEILQ